MSSLLPMKETSREVVVEVTHALQPWFPEITNASASAASCTTRPGRR